MKPELPQPFNIEDINSKPKAVVIALLIGLLLIFGSVIGVLFYRKEELDKECETDKKELYNIILTERQERIQLYESMLFYKEKSQRLKDENDSIVSQTRPLVNKILKQ